MSTVTEAERSALAECIHRAREASDVDGKAGISAAVLKGGVVIAWGDNQVHLDNDITRHAEVVAMARATAALDTPDLSGCTLLSTLQPCEMCLSAMRFAGIRRVVFAATKPRVAAKYFVFPELTIEQFEDADKGAFEWVGGVLEAEVLDLYAEGDE
ncbi:nucleoside deaminase [Tropicimonas aquimaris]|uniref:Nucleoside deaminase n=1 Tax=Tropicimonas aquimaris TaxID=914152 RepID=A0ABW3IUJ8_9RHOB